VDPLTANIIGNRLFPPGGMVEAWQACPLRLALSLVSGQDLNGADSIVVEMHGSQAIAGDPPLAGIEHTLTESAGPWTLDFTGAQMNQTVQEGHTFRSLWMCIVAVFVSTDRLEVLATREIKLHRHNASLSAPEPPDPALSWLTAEQIAAVYTPLTTHAELEGRVGELEASGGTAPHTHVSSDITDAAATPVPDKLVKYGAEGQLSGSSLLFGAVAVTPPAASGQMATVAATAAGYQPLDSDLTAIAALDTTVFGRSFLTLADAAAARALLALGTLATISAPGNASLYLDGTGAWSDPQGGIAGGFFRFNIQTTAADPGNGVIRLNASTFAAATAIYMDQISDPGTDVTAWVELMRSGDTIMIQAKADSTRRARYQITGTPANNAGWFTIPVAVVSSSGAVPASGVVMAVVADYDGGGGGGAAHTHVSADITDASTVPTPDKVVKYGASGELRGGSTGAAPAVTGDGFDIGARFTGSIFGAVIAASSGTAVRAEAQFGYYVAEFADIQDAPSSSTVLAIRRTDGALVFADGSAVALPPTVSGAIVTVQGAGEDGTKFLADDRTWKPVPVATHTHVSADITDASTSGTAGKLAKYDAGGALRAVAPDGNTAVSGQGTQYGGYFSGEIAALIGSSGAGTGLRAESESGANIAAFRDEGAEVTRLAIRRTDGALLWDDGTVAVLRAPAGGTMATQEHVQTQRVQMITPPLSSLADSRGAVGDMCYNPSTPQYLYHKISVSPHKWVFGTVADSL
jgi:hypothetical protein